MAAKKFDVIEAGKLVLFASGLFLLWKFFKGTGLIKTGQEAQAETYNEQIESQDWTNINFYKKPAPSGKKIVLFTKNAAKAIALLIYESHGFWNDNENQMKGALKNIKYKTQYSFVADVFFKKYAEDLTAFLKQYYSESELYPVWDYLNKLPTYANK